MKVCVAARTLSQTVASAIESMIASGSSGCSSGFLPPEAMHTAQFVHDMYNLFDSLNENSPRGEMGKSYRRCLSKSRGYGTLISGYGTNCYQKLIVIAILFYILGSCTQSNCMCNPNYSVKVIQFWKAKQFIGTFKSPAYYQAKKSGIFFTDTIVNADSISRQASRHCRVLLNSVTTTYHGINFSS